MTGNCLERLVKSKMSCSHVRVRDCFTFYYVAVKLNIFHSDYIHCIAILLSNYYPITNCYLKLTKLTRFRIYAHKSQYVYLCLVLVVILTKLNHLKAVTLRYSTGASK